MTQTFAIEWRVRQLGIKHSNLPAHVGPILGKVEEGIFVPFTYEEAQTRAQRWNRFASRGIHKVVRKELTDETLTEVRKVHDEFYTIRGFEDFGRED